LATGRICSLRSIAFGRPDRNRAKLAPSEQCVQQPFERKEKGVAMAELDTRDREKMDKRKFAYVDKEIVRAAKRRYRGQ
jgi:hypothetical protein